MSTNSGIMMGFSNGAVHGVNRIQNSKSLEQALQHGRNIFPTMPDDIIERIYLRTCRPTFSEDGNTLYAVDF